MTGDRAERMVDTFFHANSHIYSEDVVNMIRREQAWLRRTVLLERLNQSQSRIGTMCSERRGPRLSIPVRAVDDDFYICTTLRDAASTIARLERELAHEVAQNNIAGEQLVTMAADNFERAKALIGAGNAVSQLAAMTQERDEAVETGRQNAVKYAEAEARLQARIVQLETDADAVAWNVSPAMAQATIERLQRDLDAIRAMVGDTDFSLRRDVAQLNNVLRQAGWGQGEIDSAAYTFDKLDRCAYLCPIHLQPCILKKYHTDASCLCQDILECKAAKQLEEACWDLPKPVRKGDGDECL